MSTKVQKSLQNRLKLEDKVEILKKSDKGVNGKRLALEYGVSEAAICKIKKKRLEILEATSNTLESAQKKKRFTNQNSSTLKIVCMNGS